MEQFQSQISNSY